MHATVVYLSYDNPKFNKLHHNAEMLNYKNYTCGLYPEHINIINGDASVIGKWCSKQRHHLLMILSHHLQL
jgi:hypothetical protein